MPLSSGRSLAGSYDRLLLRMNRSLWSRIHTRLHLGETAVDDTAEYLAHRLEGAGGKSTAFSSDAVAMLHEASSGRLRDLDRLATETLRRAARRKFKAVDRTLVQEVASARTRHRWASRRCRDAHQASSFKGLMAIKERDLMAISWREREQQAGLGARSCAGETRARRASRLEGAVASGSRSSEVAERGAEAAELAVAPDRPVRGGACGRGCVREGRVVACLVGFAVCWVWGSVVGLRENGRSLA